MLVVIYMEVMLRVKADENVWIYNMLLLCQKKINFVPRYAKIKIKVLTKLNREIIANIYFLIYSNKNSCL